MSNEEVVLSYASSANSSFRGTIETGILKSEWDEMPEKEQNQVLEEHLWELVQSWVED